MLRPRLKPFLTWERLADRILILQGGGLSLYFEGDAVPALAALLPHLDGRTVEEGAAAAGLTMEDAQGLVGALAPKGVLDDVAADDEGPDTAISTALSVYTATPRRAAARLGASSVLVVGDGEAASVARGLLARSGVGRVVGDAPGLSPDFVVLAEDAPTADGLRHLQKRAGPTPATRVTLNGAVAWLGPTLAPGHACFDCFDERIRGQHQRPETLPAYERALRLRPPTPAALPTLVAQAAALAVQEAVFVASGARPAALLDRAAEFLPGGGVRVHPVLPVPGCPGCGGPPP